MTNQKPLVGRNVGVLAHNGDGWRKLRSDAEGRLLVAGQLGAQLRTAYIRRREKWALSIGPGETYSVLDTTLGKGRVIHCYFRVDGKAGPAKYSSILFTVDGESSAAISPDMIYSFFVGRRITDISQAGVITWDETNYIYEVWWDFNPAFKESLQIRIVNEDLVNAIEVRYGIWVEWWK